MKSCLYFVSMLLLLCTACSSTAAHSSGQTGIPPEFTIINSSEYTINRLYVTDGADYRDASPATGSLEPGKSLSVPVTEGADRYVTFVRNATSTSSIEIAVTTSSAIAFEYNYSYVLHLLEQDFYLEKNPFPDVHTITAFSLDGVAGTISDGAITLTLPAGTVLTKLAAVFTFAGAAIAVNGVQQISGVTVHDFSSPVVYTVTAEDGSSENYTVSVVTGL